MLKGISGRLLFMNYPELKEQLRKEHLWNSSFYIETIRSIIRRGNQEVYRKTKNKGMIW
jgi:putative transposase